jgi:hypothetical protein
VRSRESQFDIYKNPNNINKNERSKEIRRMKGYEKEGKEKGRGIGKVA